MYRFIIMFLLCAHMLSAGTVEFSYAFRLQSSGAGIDVGSYAAPMMVDWDSDGRQDLICGQFDFGRIRFYRNTGSDDAPEFDGFQYLLDGAEYLSVPYG